MVNDYKNKIYENYHSIHTKKLYGDISIETIKRQFKFWKYFFSEYLPTDKNIKILDAGCGNGGFVYWLTQIGYKNTIGIDISEELIDLGISLNIKNIEQDDLIDHLKKHEGTYDIIFCRDVLEHFTKNEIIEIFSLFNSALKSSGKVIIQVPNGYSPNFGRIYYGDFTHETLFSETILNQIINATGYKFIKLKEVNPVPHGFVSLIRFVLWKLLRMKFQFYQMIETGYAKGFFTQNIIAEIKK
ncbi:class I SAM-dependent methyltransferase [Ignavibacterium sp.]|uniref:class I SAM-dependent methyltransferase n=1 Tax=Ignavibacterium sp. TaxID=2651167 RepID=UPI00307FB233